MPLAARAFNGIVSAIVEPAPTYTVQEVLMLLNGSPGTAPFWGQTLSWSGSLALP